MRIRESFLEAGHQVVEPTEGGDSIDKYRTSYPDAVRMDIKMPDMSGIDALKKLRAMDHEIKVTLITGDGQRESAGDANLNGFVDFILNPFTHQRLLEAAAKMLP
jgi:DNA-binding NtrC family response regulator